MDLGQGKCFSGKRNYFSLGMSSINSINSMIGVSYVNSIFNVL